MQKLALLKTEMEYDLSISWNKKIICAFESGALVVFAEFCKILQNKYKIDNILIGFYEDLFYKKKFQKYN